MPNLCETCSSLSVSATELKDMLKASSRSPQEAHVVHKLFESFFFSIDDLIGSASGDTTGAKCHLCLLILQSLQGSDNQETDGWQRGPLKLQLVMTPEETTLVAQCSGRLGHPLQVSIGSGQLLPHAVAYLSYELSI
jgi:hypothetical protein